MVAFGPPDRDGHRFPPPVRAHQSSAPLKTVTASASPHGCRERTGKKVGKSRWRQGKSSRTVQGPTRAARHSRDKNGRLGVLAARSALIRSDSQEKIGAQWRGWGEKGGILEGTTVAPGHRVVPNTGGGGRGEVIGVGLLRSVVDTHYPAPAGPESVVDRKSTRLN